MDRRGPAARESNTARAVSDVYRVPFSFSRISDLCLSHCSPIFHCPSLSLFFSSFFSGLFFSSLLRRYGVSIYLTTLSRPPIARFTRDLDFVPRPFPSHGLGQSSYFPFVSSTCLRPVLVLSASSLRSPGVFSIDYETTIDLPDCAGEDGAYRIPPGTGSSLVRRPSDRQKKRQGGRGEATVGELSTKKKEKK